MHELLGDMNVAAVVSGTVDFPGILDQVHDVAVGSFAVAGSHIVGIAGDTVHWGSSWTAGTADLMAGGDVVAGGVNCLAGDTLRRL